LGLVIRVQREPFEAKGQRAEAFAASPRIAKERLWHVEIAFVQPVHGPLLIGDGRYLGLGLMAPVRRTEGVFAFSIADGLTSQAEPQSRGRLPTPEVEVAQIFGKSGMGLFGQVKLTFHSAVEGPILLGRDRHFGGGLFVAAE
jgi:hypothetical protein